MFASWKDSKPQAKEEEEAAVGAATATPAAPAPTQPSHSQGLNAFLTQLSGAYASSDSSAIRNAQNSLIGALQTEKKIEKKRVEVKKDNEFAELFDKTLDVKEAGNGEAEMETEIKGGSDVKGKKAKKDNCCGCGGCDEF